MAISLNKMIIDSQLSSVNFVYSLLLTNILLLLNVQHIDATSCLFTNSQIGQCIKFAECQSAVTLFKKGINPAFCNLEGGIVCCTDNVKKAESADHNSRRPNPEASFSNLQNWQNDFLNQKDEDHMTQIYKNHNNDASSVLQNSQKKKPWRDEKIEENDYYFEHITKKYNHKNPNKQYGNNYTPNNSPKRTVENSTRKNEWSNQNERTTKISDWYGNQNEYENDYSRHRTTTQHNKWPQEIYTTSTNIYSESNYGENGDEYFSRKPIKRPHRTSTEKPHTNRPYFQPDFGHSENNRPNFQQGSTLQSNSRPNARPGLHKKRKISEQKCEEYSKQVTENITGLPLTTNPDPVVIPVRKCIQPQQLIVGGENTTLGEFPHMAAIGFQDRFKKQIVWNCGGTLISDRFVITAAHCTSSSLGRPVKVRLGEYNLMKNDDGAHPVDYAIVDIIIHPEYKPPSKYNDIALLKLSRKVSFFKHIRPACLYSEDSLSAKVATATGWGRLNYGGNMSETLQKVTLSIVDNNTCKRLYKLSSKTAVLSRGIVESQMCAGELTGGKDTCQGDSGGPLSIINTKCIHHIIGITSFGRSCALPNSTGVYTRISSYLPWIENIVWPTT